MRKENKRGKIDQKRNLMLVTSDNMPFSYVEAYKSLRTNIKFLKASNNANCFVLTSAIPMESKSNVSVNIAVTLAEENNKVLLVDGDLRKPVIHKMLKIHSGDVGISGVLSGEYSVSDAIVKKEDFNFDILPVGAIPPNPAELLAHDRMQNLLKELKEQYDYVIIDAPPISVVTDAAIIGGVADGAFLVVRSNFAPVEMIQLAKKKLEDVNVKIFGTVITRYNPKNAGKQSGYYYSYSDKNDYYASYETR